MEHNPVCPHFKVTRICQEPTAYYNWSQALGRKVRVYHVSDTVDSMTDRNNDKSLKPCVRYSVLIVQLMKEF